MGGVPTRGEAARAVLLLAACAGAVWPWRATLHLVPSGGDAARWLLDGAWDNPAWPEWVFLSRHFVGWRPLTALSYTVVDAIAGGTPTAHHGLDLFLFACCGAAAWAAARWGLGASPHAATVAALVTWWHPHAVHIVPFESRRSYLLAVATTLLAVALRARPAAAALFLGAALLCNEFAYAAVFPIFLLVSGRGRWGAVGVAVLSVAARLAVIGDVGGYARRYAAVQGADGLLLQRSASWREPLEGALGTLLAPVGLDGAPPALSAGWAAFLLLPLLAVTSSRRDRVAAAVLLWATALLALYAWGQTWFWRMGFPFVPLLALTVALGWDAASRAGAALRIAVAAPSCALGLALAARSPVFAGIDRHAFGDRFAITARYQAVVDDVATLPARGAVLLAFPLDLDDGVLFRASLTRQLRHREATVYLLTVADSVPRGWTRGAPWVDIVTTAGGRVARLRDGVRLTVVQQQRLGLPPTAREVPLRDLGFPRRATRLVWPTADGIARLDLP